MPRVALLPIASILALAISASSYGDQPNAAAADAVYFVQHVQPMLTELGCNATACHGSSTGKASLKLSMFGASALDDYLIVTKAMQGRRVDLVEPAKSLLVRKLTGELPHGGGKKIEPGSSQAESLVRWIRQGVPYADAEATELTSIAIVPPAVTLKQGETAKVTVQAKYADGSERDVTVDAKYRTADNGPATVDASGTITATGIAEAIVVVSYQRQFAVTRSSPSQPRKTASTCSR